MDKDEFPDYMQSFDKEIDQNLKQDLNRHINRILQEKIEQLPLQMSQSKQQDGVHMKYLRNLLLNDIDIKGDDKTNELEPKEQY